MIRPRCGDFLYSESEFLVMKEDIQAFKTLFVQGFVFGILSANGTIDIERTKTYVLLYNARMNCFQYLTIAWYWSLDPWLVSLSIHS